MPLESRRMREFTDEELAAMIRRSAYLQNHQMAFGPGDNECRFLLVLAIPYGERDGVTDLPAALDAFFRFVQDSDYEQRSLEVYDHNAGGRYFDASVQEVRGTTDEEPAGSPAQSTLRYTRSDVAIRDLKHVADYIKPEDFPLLAAKVRSAIKSAEGAHRHAQRMAAKENRK